MAKACDFKTSEASTKAWFRANGLLDKYLNIPEGSLNNFRKNNAKWTNYARVKYGVSEGMLFGEKEGGKRAVPNKKAFKAIDNKKGIFYAQMPPLITTGIINEYKENPGFAEIGTITEFAEYKNSKEKISFEAYMKKQPKRSVPRGDTEGTLDEKTRKRLGAFLANYGIKVEYIDNMRERTGDDYRAVALIFQNLILVANGKEKADTLPEEVAHFAVELLGENNPLIKRLMDNIEDTDIYRETYEEVKDKQAYIDENGNPNINKIKKEAVGKAIRDKIVKKEVKYKKGLGRTLAIVWERVKNIFKKINIEKFRDEVDVVSSNIANQILSGNLQDRTIDLQKVGEQIENAEEFFGQAETKKAPATKEAKLIKKINQQLAIRYKRLKNMPKKSTEAKEMRETIDSLEAMLVKKQFESAMELFLHTSKKELMPVIKFTQENKDKKMTPDMVRNVGSFIETYEVLVKDAINIISRNLDLDPKNPKLTSLLTNAKEIMAGIDQMTNIYDDIRMETNLRTLVEMNNGRLQQEIKDEDGNIIGYEDVIQEDILEEVSEDTSWIRKFAGNLKNATDPILKLVYDTVKTIKEQVFQYTYTTARRIIKAQEDLYKSGIKNTSVFYEKDKKGNYTGFIISKYNRGEWNDAKDKFLNDLAKEFNASSYAELNQDLLTASQKITLIQKRRSWFQSKKNALTSFVNPKFAELMKNPAAKAYYDLIMEVKDESVKKLPVKQQEYFTYLAPQVRKSTTERLLKGKDGKLKDIAQLARESIALVEDDIEFQGAEVMTDVNGQKFKFLPTYFTRRLDDMSNLTNDLSGSMILYAKMAEDFYQKNTQLPALELIREQIGKRRVTARRGKKDKQRKETNTYQMLDSFMDMHFYGQLKSKDQKITINGKTYNYGKVLDTFNAYIRRNNLGFNIFTTAAGYTVGSVYSKIEDLVGDYTNQESKLWAEKEFWPNIAQVMSQVGKKRPTNKMHLMFMKHGFLSTNFQDLNIETQAGRQLKDIFYSTYQLADYRVKGKIALAIMDNLRYYKGEWVNKQQFTRNFIDSSKDKKTAKKEAEKLWSSIRENSFYNAHFVNKSGEIEVLPKFKDKIDLNTQKLVKNRIIHIGNRADGMLDEMDKGALAQSVWGRLIMTHRGWLIKGAEDRFKKAGLNLDTMVYEEGYTRAAANYVAFGVGAPVVTFIRNMFREKKQEVTPFLANWRNLNENQRKGVLRTLFELISIGMIMGLIKAFEDSLDDEDDWIATMALYLLYRSKLELSAFYNPLEYRRLLKSPAAGLNQVESIMDAMSLLITVDEEGTWGPMQKLQKGRFKDKTRFEKFIWQRSIGKQFYDAFYPEDKLAFLK